MKKRGSLNYLPATLLLICAMAFFIGIGKAQAQCMQIAHDTTNRCMCYDSTANSIALPSTIIATASSWSFSTSDEQPFNWPNITSLPGGPGNAPFGFINAEKTNTTLPARHTYYFIKSITLNPSLYNDFTFDILLADGAIIYINGVATGSINLPECASYNTDATAIANPQRPWHFIVANSFFINGKNTIQVEVHTSAAKGYEGNIFFGLEMCGNKPYIPVYPLKEKWKHFCNCCWQ